MIALGYVFQTCNMVKSDNIFGATWCGQGSNVSSTTFGFETGFHCAGCYIAAFGAIALAITLVSKIKDVSWDGTKILM